MQNPIGRTWRITISGCIQGIGFRPFIFRMAQKAQMGGYVTNMGNGKVEIVVSGSTDKLTQFMMLITEQKPELAVYDNIQRDEIAPLSFEQFTINPSKQGDITPHSSYIPPDLALCQDCLQEIQNSQLPRRYKYPFTSCVNCGPRYTIIDALPYDRPNTEMKHFPFCQACSNEYSDPYDRRMHAQTTCCTQCGPQYQLYDGQTAKEITGHDIFSFLGEKIIAGKIVAIKGIGGTHLACDPQNDSTLARLRQLKGERAEKPFALMALSLTNIEQFAYLPDQARSLLLSLRRPIVLLTKRETFALSSLVAPKLHNIGVMLPYSGLHYLLLWASLPVLVMTSANISNQPMLIENEQILKEIRENQLADYILLHNRLINQRCDDSVLKSFYPETFSPMFIRRSRGFTPEPISLPKSFSRAIGFATGAEMHTAPAYSVDGKIFQTQYIGTVTYRKNWQFWHDASQHLRQLLHIDQIAFVAADFHPSYETTIYAQEYTQEHQIPLVQVQHHHAHATSLMVDNDLNKESQLLAITLDGVGYGDDQSIWGGELLDVDYSAYTRVGSINAFPLPGGDKATEYPIRSAIGLLYNAKWTKEEVQEKLECRIAALPHGNAEFNTIWQQLERNINCPMTSSLGRVLDAAAAILGITSHRTYEGSPAIQLESAALSKLESSTTFKSGIQHSTTINTSYLLEQLLEQSLQNSVTALAASFQQAIAKDFVDLGLQLARDRGLSMIGLTGGVAVNYFIRKAFHDKMKNLTPNIALLEHKQIAPGDGGIAVGQLAVGLAKSL